MAVYVRDTPFGIDALAGVTVICARLAALTVRLAEPVRPPNAAMIWIGYTLDWTPVANPSFVTVAMEGADEDQVTTSVRSKLVPLL